MSRMETVNGFTPDLIGRVVSVTVIPKNRQGETFPEHAERFVGTLKSYFKSEKSQSGSFVINGYQPRDYTMGATLVTVYILAGEKVT